MSETPPLALEWTGTRDGRPELLLAHGAGADMRHEFLALTAAGLAARGLAVARFNFPYTRRAQALGRSQPPDRMPVLVGCWREALAQRGSSPAPVVLAGKSMGGRAASMLLAEATPPGVRGGVWLGYPLHPAKKPQELRSAHLPRIAVPQLYVSGTKDPLCELPLLEAALAPLGKRATLLRIEGGDHSLATSRKDPMRDAAVWLDAVAQFVREVSSRPAP